MGSSVPSERMLHGVVTKSPLRVRGEKKGSPFGKESSWLRIRTQDHRLVTAVTIPNELISGLAAGSAKTNTWIIVSLPVSSVCSSRLSRPYGGSGFDHRTGSSCSATKLSFRECASTPLVNIPWRRKFSQDSMYTDVQFFNSNETYVPASATFHLLLLSMLLIVALSLLEQSKKEKKKSHTLQLSPYSSHRWLALLKRVWSTRSTGSTTAK